MLQGNDHECKSDSAHLKLAKNGFDQHLRAGKRGVMWEGMERRKGGKYGEEKTPQKRERRENRERREMSEGNEKREGRGD